MEALRSCLEARFGGELQVLCYVFDGTYVRWIQDNRNGKPCGGDRDAASGEGSDKSESKPPAGGEISARQGGRCCPQGHTLAHFITDCDGWTCSECESKFCKQNRQKQPHHDTYRQSQLAKLTKATATSHDTIARHAN